MKAAIVAVGVVVAVMIAPAHGRLFAGNAPALAQLRGIPSPVPTERGGRLPTFEREDGCCEVVSRDTRKRRVTARETATARTFRFTVEDAALFRHLGAGQPFDVAPEFGRLEEGQSFSIAVGSRVRAQVSRAKPCCRLVSVGEPGVPKGSPSVGTTRSPLLPGGLDPAPGGTGRPAGAERLIERARKILKDRIGGGRGGGFPDRPSGQDRGEPTCEENPYYCGKDVTDEEFCDLWGHLEEWEEACQILTGAGDGDPTCEVDPNACVTWAELCAAWGHLEELEEDCRDTDQWADQYGDASGGAHAPVREPPQLGTPAPSFGSESGEMQGDQPWYERLEVQPAPRRR